MHLIQVVSRSDAIVVVAQCLPLLGRQFYSTRRLWGIEPYMQEDLSLNTKQYPILTISLIFCSPRQGQRIFTNFLDIQDQIILYQQRYIFISTSTTI